MKPPNFANEVACDQSAWWALPAAYDIPRVTLEGSGPGGIRLAWDHGAKWEQGQYKCRNVKLSDRLVPANRTCHGTGDATADDKTKGTTRW